MLPIAWYFLKVTVCSGILLGYYWLALRNKVFHHYNRFYLLSTILLSTLLPFVQLTFQASSTQRVSTIKVLEAVSYGNTFFNKATSNGISASHYNWQWLYPTAYLLISLLLLFVFIKMLLQIRALLLKYPVAKIESISFINTNNEKGTPFSFLRYIFWNSQIDITTKQGNQIFKHELAHINEKHTYDKLFINGLLILFWSNPFFWLIRKELNLIHEFIADKKAVEDGDTGAFAAMILQSIYPNHQLAIVNNFFYSPIKRRLLMLTKIKNPTANYFGRILVLPLAVIMFAAFTLKVNKSKSLYHGKKVTVVIDAGHGGEKDPGATSNTGIQEKDLVLAFAKEIKALNTNDAIDIVLARENDIYLSPKEKAELAIRNNADLLISLHVDKNPTSATETGISFFVAKNQYPNAPQSKILATALINAFTTNYPLPVATLPKQRNVGIWILQAVNVPSVLIEAGFISNENDVKYLQSKVGKETIAQNILKAINTYLKEKTTIHTITNTDTIPEKSKLPTEEQWKKAMPSKDDTTLFKSSQIKDYTYSPQLIINDNNSKALYIINGKEVVKNELDEIDPERITDVRVLKGATATQIYGDKGKNGVVIVNIKPRTGGPFADKLIANDDDLKKLGKNPYIEVDGKIYEGNSLEKFMLATGINRFSSITIYGPDEAIKKFGNKAVDGAVIAITKKDQLKADFRNPQFYVGNLTGGRKELTLFKKQKEINISDGYSFESATVYFSGKGFEKVETTNLWNSDLSVLKNLIDKCVDGSNITFDNIRVKKEGIGIIVIDGTTFSMNDNAYTDADDKFFTKVETEAEFTGGASEWKKYLMKNLNAAIPVDEGWKPGVYKVIVKFIVSKEGYVSDVVTENYIGSKTAKHCIELIKNTPKWVPATQNGVVVNAYRRQPITFVIEEVNGIKN